MVSARLQTFNIAGANPLASGALPVWRKTLLCRAVQQLPARAEFASANRQLQQRD
jgi:hypothetical protein